MNDTHDAYYVMLYDTHDAYYVMLYDTHDAYYVMLYDTHDAYYAMLYDANVPTVFLNWGVYLFDAPIKRSKNLFSYNDYFLNCICHFQYKLK